MDREKKSLGFLSMVGLMVGAAALPVYAVGMPVHWDGGNVNIAANGNGVSGGTAGTWNTTIQNWDVGVSPHVAWNNANDDIAVFGGTAGAVTLGANVTVGGITSNTNGYSIAPGVGPFAITFGTPGNIDVSTGTTTISAAIGGSAITKIGGGTLTLTGTNTYTGGTTLSAGTLATSADAHLGAAGGGITVNGNSTWNMGGAVAVTYNRDLTINGGTLNLASGNNGKTVTGVLSGTGTLVNTATTGIAFTNTGNTFTGTVNSGYTMSFASLGDSSNPINLVGSNSDFIWTGGAKAFALRPFTLQAPSTQPDIRNNGTGALTIQQDLAITGAAGARALTLGGSFTGGANIFAGDITDGVGSVVSLTKAGDNSIWALSGTNTYTGATALPAGGSTSDLGLLIFRGMQSLSSSTSLNQTQSGFNQRWGTVRLLDDSASPADRSGVNLSWSIQENIPSSTLNRHYIRVFVGNNSVANGGTSASTQTGSTIQLGNLNLTEGAAAATGSGLLVTGANGYKLQIADVNITLLGTTTDNWNATLRADAPLTVTGTVRQATGGGLGSRTTLQLDGSAIGNLISGDIMDSADGTPRVMNVTKLGTGSWTLSGTNTYTGLTTISGGLLELDGSILSTSDLIFSGTGLLDLGFSGLINVLQSNYSIADAQNDIIASRIFASGTLLVSTFNNGTTNFTQLKLESISSAVPEPATAALGLMGLAGLMMRRRRAAV